MVLVPSFLFQVHETWLGEHYVLARSGSLEKFCLGAHMRLAGCVLLDRLHPQDLKSVVVLSGCADISFQSVKEGCSHAQEFYAGCRVVGGTAVFQGLIEPMT